MSWPDALYKISCLQTVNMPSVSNAFGYRFSWSKVSNLCGIMLSFGFAWWLEDWQLKYWYLIVIPSLPVLASCHASIDSIKYWILLNSSSHDKATMIQVGCHVLLLSMSWPLRKGLCSRCPCSVTCAVSTLKERLKAENSVAFWSL